MKNLLISVDVVSLESGRVPAGPPQMCGVNSWPRCLQHLVCYIVPSIGWPSAGGGRLDWDGLFSVCVCVCVCLVLWTLRHYLASVIWGMQASPQTDTQDGPDAVAVTGSRNTEASLNEGRWCRKENLEKVRTSKGNVPDPDVVWSSTETNR